LAVELEAAEWEPLPLGPAPRAPHRRQEARQKAEEEKVKGMFEKMLLKPPAETKGAASKAPAQDFEKKTKTECADTGSQTSAKDGPEPQIETT